MISNESMIMKRQAVILILMLMFLLAVSLAMFISMVNPSDLNTTFLVKNLLYNFPLFLIMGLIDYSLIKVVSRKKNNGKMSISAALPAVLLTPLLWGCIAFIISITLSYTFSIVRNVLPAVLCNGIITLFIYMYLYARGEIKLSRRLAIAENEKIKYQFEALKNQVNPHFLFNSLNVLSSLTYESPELANKFVKKLSVVYRYILTTSQNPTVNLSDEMRFVSSYLYLEKMRHGNCLLVDIKESPNIGTRQIIPVSVQMLVENALKHNIATPDKPLHILINEEENGVTVSNNIQRRNNRNNMGVGLINLRKQYELYHQQIIISENNNDFTVFLPFVHAVNESNH